MNEKLFLTNRMNPFESFGIRHNYALDVVGNTPNFQKLTFKEIYDLVIGSNGANYQPHSFFADVQHFYFNELPTLLDSDEKITDLIFVWNRINIATKKYLDILIGLMKLNTGKEPREYCMELINFENNIIKNNHDLIAIFDIKTLTCTYKKDDPLIVLILGASVIARYSYYYWYTAYNDPKNPWYKYLHEDEVKALPRWLRAAWKDVGSFFSAPCSYNVDGTIVTDLGCCWEYASDCSSAVQ